MKKRIFKLGGIAIFLFCLLSYSLANASPLVLSLSHQWAKGDIRDQWATKWADLVKQKTNGEVTIKIFPAASLFRPKAQFAAMRKGALDATVLHQIYLAGKIPAYAITSMPCLVKTVTQGTAWGRNEIGRKLDELGIKNGFRHVSWGCIMGVTISKDKPILIPKDVKGLKMRGAGPMVELLLNKAGAAISSMPATEIYFALQTGGLDALMTTPSSVISYRLYEVTNHYIYGKEYSIGSGHVGILLANATWDKLTENQIQAVLEAGKEVEPFFVKKAEDIIDEGAKLCREKGLKVHLLGEKEYNSWFELAKATSYKAFVKKVKGGQELLDLALSVK